MLGPILILGLFVAALGWMAVEKARRGAAVMRAAVPLEGSIRRVFLFAAAPGIGVAVWLTVRGLEPPAAVAVGGAGAAGVLSLALGLLGMEGALVESGSDAELRVAEGAPPPSTPLGRAIAIVVGLALLAGAGLGCWSAG